MTDPDAYICGGYYLVRRIPRPPDVSELISDTLLTLSNCFTDVAPGDWAVQGYNYDDEDRAEEAAKFGIPASAVPQLVALMSRERGTQHSNAFPTLSVAQAFYRPCTNKEYISLVGIGLDPMLLPSLEAQRNDDINHGCGLMERVELKRPLEAGGDALGYEPLGFEATSFHSWLCHNAPEEAWKRFGIRPNRNGFIESLAEAVRVTEHLKATGAEPALWEPWLVVRYGVGAEPSREGA